MSRRARKNVGVIGLGIIGRRVAENLRHRGFHTFVWNRTPRAVPNFVGSVAEVAELCDFVQIFVADDEALLETVQRIKTTLTVHHIVMAHCTVSPDTMRAAAEIVQRRGAQFLDAPFTGSKNAAEKSELVYYIGGDEAALRQVRPVLEASSKEILEIGGIGDATTIKVATNMITAATVQAAAEALALVHNSGLSLEKFAVAMRGNGSNSGTLEMKLPLMLAENFEPHFSVKHMLKDVAIATRLARSFGIELGATDAVRRSLADEARDGRGDADYCSVIRRYFPDGVPAGAPSEAPPSDEAQPSLDLAEVESTPSQKLSEIIEALPESTSPGTPGDGMQSENVRDPIIVPSVSLATEKTEELAHVADKNAGAASPSGEQPVVTPNDAVAECRDDSRESAPERQMADVGADNRPDAETKPVPEPEATVHAAESSEETPAETAVAAPQSAGISATHDDAGARRGLLSRLWRRGDEG